MSKYSHVLVVSGGMDSATLAHMCVQEGGSPYLITFDYGQKHRKEIEYAVLLAKNLGVTHQVVDISNIQNLLGGSALTDDGIEIPEGHYAASNMAITVVPTRNAIFLTIADGAAVSFQSNAKAISLINGTIMYEITPITIDRPNHCEKLATNPK